MAAKRLASATESDIQAKFARRDPFARGPSRNNWDNALLLSLKDSSLHLYKDDNMVIIADKFPKSRFHFLGLARPEKCRADGVKDLKPADLPLLEHIFSQSQQFAETNIIPNTKNSIRYGFHMVPSMKLLHMHIISQDFAGSALKNKKHWNSFTSPFFMDSVDVLKMLKEQGKVSVDADGERFHKEDLRCHVCRVALQNMPKLKEHIKVHDKDYEDRKKRV